MLCDLANELPNQLISAFVPKSEQGVENTQGLPLLRGTSFESVFNKRCENFSLKSAE